MRLFTYRLVLNVWVSVSSHDSSYASYTSWVCMSYASYTCMSYASYTWYRVMLHTHLWVCMSYASYIYCTPVQYMSTQSKIKIRLLDTSPKDQRIICAPCKIYKYILSSYIYIYIYIYIYVLFGPVKPELGSNSIRTRKLFKSEHLNFPGKELNVTDITEQ